MVIYTHDEDETSRAGENFVKCLGAGSVVALYGDLGAGKTAFVRGMARGLGISERVSSPTFTIVNEYLGKTPLFHFDMYRLSSPEELFEIGWEDYLERGGICAVEWSENVSGAFPSGTIKVKLDKIDESVRRITIDNQKEAE